MAKVTVLISTMGERVRDIVLPEFNVDVCYVVVHQKPSVAVGFNRKDVTYHPSSNIGLSKSRNEAIKNCSTKYALICDDDVLIDTKSLLAAVGFAESMGSDIITCEFVYSNGQKKTYPKSGTLHSYKSLASVCSIEILINVKAVMSNAISFDEEFGLGTPLPSGEEYIFLTDALKLSLEIRHCSQVICTHPPITSGMDFFTTKDKILAKRYMIIRVFGLLSPLIMFVFFLKKIKVLILERKFLFFARYFLFK